MFQERNPFAFLVDAARTGLQNNQQQLGNRLNLQQQQSFAAQQNALDREQTSQRDSQSFANDLTKKAIDLQNEEITRVQGILAGVDPEANKELFQKGQAYLTKLQQPVQGEGQAALSSLYRDNDLVAQLGRASVSTAQEREDTQQEVAYNRELNAMTLQNQLGQNTQITLADMQRAHELTMQGNDKAAREELAKLDAKLNLEAGSTANAYQMARDERLFQQQMTFDQVAAERDRLDKEKERIQTYIETGQSPEFITKYIDSLMSSSGLSADGKAELKALRGVTNEEVREQFVGQLQLANAERADELARLKQNPDVRQAELDKLQQDIRAGEVAIQLAEKNVTIAGQEIVLNDIATDEQKAGNAYNNYLRERQKVLDGTFDVKEAKTYVKDLMEGGNVAGLEELKLALSDPDSPFAPLVIGVTEEELNNAIEIADELRNLESVNRGYLQQELAHNTKMLGMAEDKASLDYQSQRLNTLAALGTLYGPEEIEQAIADDPTLSTVFGSADIAAAKSNAAVNETILRDEMNGKKIVRSMDRIQKFYAGTPADPVAAEASLAAELQGLVELGELDPSQVDGIVSMFKQGWSNTQTAFDGEMAMLTLQGELVKANTQDAIASAALRYKQAAASGSGGRDFGDYMDAVGVQEDIIKTKLSAVEQDAKIAGCLNEMGALLSEGQCANYGIMISSLQDDLSSLSTSFAREAGLPVGLEDQIRLDFQAARGGDAEAAGRIEEYQNIYPAGFVENVLGMPYNDPADIPVVAGVLDSQGLSASSQTRDPNAPTEPLTGEEDVPFWQRLTDPFSPPIYRAPNSGGR